MKKLLSILAAAGLAACTPSIRVEVENPTDIARHSETIEIAWAELAPTEGLTADNVVAVSYTHLRAHET